MKRTIIITFLALLVVFAGVVWLQAAPTIGQVAANPAYIVVNTPTQVVFTAQITDPSFISANLLRTDANGNAVATVGVMRDDGTNGDVTAGDKVFSFRVSLNQATVGPIHYRVSAAFRGLLRRVLSNTIVLDVWQAYENAALGLALSIPPTLTFRDLIEATHKQITFLTPPGTSEGHVLFVVYVSEITAGLTLPQWLLSSSGVANPEHVVIGGKAYLKWYEPGLGEGAWSYAIQGSGNSAITVSALSTSFADSPEFVQILSSLNPNP